MITKPRIKKWYLQQSSVVPHTNHYAGYAITKIFHDISSEDGLSYVAMIIEGEGDFGTWAMDEEELLRKGEALLNDPKRFGTLFSRWEKANAAYLTFTSQLLRKGIANILNDYLKFNKLYLFEYAPAMVADYFMVYSDIIMGNIRKQISPQHWPFLNELIAPFRKTFAYEEQESLLRISLLNQEQAKKALKEHQQNFFWMLGNYKYTEPLAVAFFQKKLDELLQKTPKERQQMLYGLEHYEEEFQEKKQKIETELHLNDAVAYQLEILSKISYWHDHRKKANLIGNYWCNEFCKKAAAISSHHSRSGPHSGVSFEELQFTLPSEFIEYLKKGKIDREILNERRKGCVVVNTIEGQESIVTGLQAKELRKRIFGADLHHLHEIKGTTACPGHVQGKVMVILNPRHAQLEKGDILVTSMTRPDFVPLMKNAAAIITNEGGVTSHAAVISRELGIPCIVGTRNATKVFKDGDLVEVDATKGMVRKIK